MLQEDTAFQNVWICPKCFEQNSKSTLTCNCGLPINQDDLSEYSGSITSQDLFKVIHNYSFIGAERKEFILSCYLLKRFPTTPEAQKVENSIDITSQETTNKYFRLLDSYIQKNGVTEVVCGKCGTTNVYNKQTQQCITCGDWLYQYMVLSKEVPREEDNAVNHDDTSAVHCPKCRSTQVTAQKQGFGLGKAAVGAVLTGGIGVFGGFRIGNGIRGILKRMGGGSPILIYCSSNCILPSFLIISCEYFSDRLYFQNCKQ